MRRFFPALFLPLLAGCAAQGDTVPKILAATANAVAEADPIVASFMDARRIRCVDTATTVVPFDACVAPALDAKRAYDASEKALLSAQAGWDAAQKDGFEAAAPCLLESLEELMRGVTVATLVVPADIADVIDLVRAFAVGECEP